MKGQYDVATPEEYFEKLEEPRKSEIMKIHNLIREIVPELEPHIRSGMIGYGNYHYKYASGREGDWFKIGLASNKNYISIYACAVVDGGYVAEKYKEKLPKASIGKSCIRFKKLDDVDVKVLKEIFKKTANADFRL
jgi:hypothetical protein